MSKSWEPVIGLEIHAQLNTKTKLFSNALNTFGQEPNTLITEVCTGQPGSLPMVNKEAVKKAVQFGLAVKGTICFNSIFERKSYFYPDSPRGFQITQFQKPIVRKGCVVAEVDGEQKTFELDRAQLEDDAGILRHFSHFAGIDYNRAGAPLLEIISTPCIHSAKQASSYAAALRAILIYLDVSDANMEEGNFRIDVNISVREKGEKGLRPRVEIKNINSFSFIEMAIEGEVKRQIALYEENPETPFETLIPTGTYRWDSVEKKTILMRTKESADDYRYFPEPDLPPLKLTQAYVDHLQETLPELPQERFRRYTTDLGLSEYNANLLVLDKRMSDFFEEARHVGGSFLSNSAKLLCNWISVEFAGRLKEKGKNLRTASLSPEHVAELVLLIENKTITARMAKAIADEMVDTPGKSPKAIIAENPDYQPMENLGELESLVDQILKDNPQSIADYHRGKDRAFSFLVGQVMKATKGKAPPDQVNALLQKKIQGLG